MNSKCRSASLLQERYFSLQFPNNRQPGLLAIFICQLARMKTVAVMNKHDVHDCIKSFKKGPVLCHNVSNLIEIMTYCTRQQIETFPSFVEFVEATKPQIVSDDIVPNVLAIIKRWTHHRSVSLGFLNHSICSKLKSQIKTEFLPFYLNAIFLLICVDFCHSTTIRECSSTKRDQRCNQWLPILEVKIQLPPGDNDRQDKQYADRRRDAGPFRFFHASISAMICNNFRFASVKTSTLYGKIGEPFFAPPYFVPEVIYNPPNLQNGDSNFLPQVLEAHAPLLLPVVYIFSKRSDPPHLRKDANTEFAGSACGGFANVNTCSPIELQKPLGKVKIGETRTIRFGEFARQHEKVISRCNDRFEIPGGLIDALFLPKPLCSAQLIICVSDLLLNGKPRNKRSNERHYRSDDAAKKAKKIRSIAVLGNIDNGHHPYRQREKGNGCSSKECRYSKREIGDSRFHTRNLPSLSRFVERVAA